MFKRDQIKVANYAMANADNLARVLQFVILTIQVPLYRVPQDTQTAREGGDDAMGVLYGHKFTAYNACEVNAERHYAMARDIIDHAETARQCAEDLIAYFATEPGFGLAKAGFVAQLIAGVGGCIDSHNIKRFKIDARTFDAHKFKSLKRLKSRRAMVARYMDVIDAQGGTERLWDGWCHYVATETMFKSAYRDADHVSEYHCIALGI